MRNKWHAFGAALLAVLLMAMPVLAEIPSVGTLQQSLKERAVENGREVQFSMQVQLEDVLGLVHEMTDLAALNEEEMAETEKSIAAVKGLVNPLTLQGSFLAQDNGFRLTLKLLSEETEAITGTLLYVDDTYYLTSNMIGEKTIAVTSDELLDKLLELGKIWLTDYGMAADEADTLLLMAESLFREDVAFDFESMLPTEELDALLASLEPYLTDVTQWMNDSLNYEEETGEFAVANNLAATTKQTVTLTAEKVYALVQTLCKRMASDEQMLGIVADSLAGDGLVTFTQEEAAAMVAAYPASIKADLFASMKPMVMTAYLDEAGNLLALYCDWEMDDASLSFYLVNVNAEDGQTVQMHFAMGSEGDQVTYDILMTEYPVVETEESNSQAVKMTYIIGITEGGDEVMQMSMIMDTNTITTATEEIQKVNVEILQRIMGEEIRSIVTATGETTAVGEKDFTTVVNEEVFFGETTAPVMRILMALGSFEGEPIAAPDADSVTWYLRLTEEEKEAFMVEITSDFFGGLMNLILLMPEESIEMVLSSAM